MNNMKRWVCAVSGGIGKVSFGLSAATIVFIAVSIMWEVISRYVIGSSSAWVTEVAGYLLAAGLFLGLGHLYRDNGHVRMSVLLDAVQPKTAYLLYLLTDLIVVIFGVVLTWQTAQLALDAYNFNWKSSTLLEAPLYIPQMVMAVGAAVFVLEVIHTALARTPNDPTATGGL